MDERFFEEAPTRLRRGFEVSLPASTVWEELCADDALHWCRILEEVRWTSPRPFGVGTSRDAKALWGASKVRERYFRWEEGRRCSFYVSEANGPFFESLAEDYLVEPRGPGACLFTWTIAFRPSAL